MDHITVSEALRQQLEALCLKSFPCGSGSWNKPHLVKGRRIPADTYWEDSDPDEESQGTLQDILNQQNSPWEPEDKYNSEAQHLRELAVKCPENITDLFIYSYFKRLRIVDKEILELCSNHISSLKDVSVNPPPLLQHLGLAYNRIRGSSESMFLTADIWPNLVSLDLSYNDLTDLFNLVSRISTLQNLRILMLQGNPLTFVTKYRGYTIDSLPKLCVLDDILILPDEKYKYSGLSKKKEDRENKAKFYVRIRKVQGIPNPSAHAEQQNSGDYPVTTVTYHVCYEFIEDQPSSDMCQSYTCDQPEQSTEGHEEQLYPLNLHTGLFKSDGSFWNENIEYDYVKEHTSTDLLALKSFLLSGMKVIVREEKILSWPKDPEENAAVSKLDKKVGGKDKEKDKARSSSRGSKTDGKSKKKKENLIELCHDPPIVKTLGSAVMPLNNLVSGVMQTFSVCNLEPFYSSIEQQHENEKCPQNSNKTKERKLKSGRENVEAPKTFRSSSGKEKQKDTEVKPAEAGPPPPVALTVEMEVQLVCV
ncbi:leucine-rich repeat-containing protein 43 isoform X2 [Bufo gargarizans]|uniref:leucine-rich repeat-containing protein 43 isoform X2 n=1 Tax=Bufo gargarizans TaxID=30331 RepID=UPI001CF5ECCE|nr:leucine-rich repeat-containing protein 43 isoform X2 [Bufo gargarizans]